MFIYELGIKEESLEKCAKIHALKLTDKEWKCVNLFCSLLNSTCATKKKYELFVPPLNAATQKVNEYYKKTADSNAHIIAIVLHPTCKITHFKKHWDSDLQNEVLTLIKNVSQLSIFTVQGALPISTFLQFFFIVRTIIKKEEDFQYPSLVI
ncbi:hypothetical protein C0995_015667 [Termitomyces sp. Mi166|nr:hypothetical protein C0995_015667 [Termitomyces sp. Mi166\